MDLKTWASATLGGARRRRGGGTEFHSEAALASYLREHPKADASKHTVAKPANDATRSESKQQPASSASPAAPTSAAPTRPPADPKAALAQVAPGVTPLNVTTLGRMVASGNLSTRLSPTDAPHIKKTLAAGLIAVSPDRQSFLLTDKGKQALAAIGHPAASSSPATTTTTSTTTAQPAASSAHVARGKELSESADSASKRAEPFGTRDTSMHYYAAEAHQRAADHHRAAGDHEAADKHDAKAKEHAKKIAQSSQHVPVPPEFARRYMQ